ncbi:hypothetical protein WJX73_010222 [Symbiochloris irregularis]|uniref:Uncharacterized protein n=1 Tax=Symbiochloris irregularis TaxID=706552 RepID=A0AAW1NYN3_9CHLO
MLVLEVSASVATALQSLHFASTQDLPVHSFSEPWRQCPVCRGSAGGCASACSVDETENQQGMAHLVEHVTFLGSAKRDRLLGTGARSNAYTDFHHTVFHVHSPLTNKNNMLMRQPMLQLTLETLAEIAFGAKFHLDRIAKERLAVVAEAQMMNTIEYRIDCQLLRFLHNENNLGCRFPIGKVEQVPKWTRQQLVDFWKKWYFPGNATLYLVGNFDRPVEALPDLIRDVFGGVPPAYQDVDVPSAQPAASLNGNGAATLPQAGSNGQAQAPAQAGTPAVPAPLRERIPRPPVEHEWGVGPLPPNYQPAPVSIFRHRLLHDFQLTLFCKLPAEPVVTKEDTRYTLMVRLLISVFHFRMNRRLMDSQLPTFYVVMDHSASSREGCTVSTLSIICEPRDWKKALEVSVQEARRLQRYGVTESELECYRVALKRDSQQILLQSRSVPSMQNLEFLMEYIALGNTYVDLSQAEWVDDLLDSITRAEVNGVAASLMSFATSYRSESEPLQDAEKHPEAWAAPGPTRATAIIACIPAYDSEEYNTGNLAPKGRGGGGMTTGMHVDPALVDQLADDEEEDEGDIPAGAVRFAVEPKEIAQVLAAEGAEVPALVDVVKPQYLVPPAELERLIAERKPEWMPIKRPPVGYESDPLPPPCPDTGIVRRRLSNGMTLTYRYTDNEPGSCQMRITAVGGRIVDSDQVGPAGIGAVVIGTRTMSESGTVGDFTREQIELFSLSELVTCMLEAEGEYISMDSTFSSGEEGIRPAMELAHMFLQQPQWTEAALKRAKQAFIAFHRSLAMSLDRGCSERVMNLMLGPDRRMHNLNYEAIDALELEPMRQTIMALLHPQNLQVQVVGDFDPATLEQMVLQYLGTVWRPQPFVAPPIRPLQLQNPPAPQRRISWHLKDSDQRACAYMAGYLPNIWLPKEPAAVVIPPYKVGPNASAEEHEEAQLVRQAHPLFRDVSLRLLVEVINSRLFTTVRDALNLTYDVTMELAVFSLLHAGWWTINVTSRPASISDAVAASMRVLRNVASSRIRHSELERAKRAVLTRLDTDCKTNMFQIQLVTHLQSDSVPSAVVESVRDLNAAIEAATLEDLYIFFDRLKLTDADVFTCIGTSGPEAPELPSMSQTGLPAMVTNYERTYTSYGQEATEAANAGAKIVQEAEGRNGKSGNAVVAALATALQSLNMAGAMKALAKELCGQHGLQAFFPTMLVIFLTS